MAAVYRWTSPKGVEDVLKSLRYKTDRETRRFNWRLQVKPQGGGAQRFTLWYGSYHRGFSYEQPTLKGDIEPAGEGCRVTARRRFEFVNVLRLVFIALMYICAGLAFAESFRYHWASGLLFFLVASGCLAWFLYTRKAHRGEQLLIMDEAAGVPHTVTQ